MAVDGNDKNQTSKLLSKTKQWAESVRTGFLKRTDVLQAIRSTILKTLEYPMPVIFLSKEVWETVLSPVLIAALPKAGICRNFPVRLYLVLPSSRAWAWITHTPSKSLLT
jgi:hypothetical protein